MHVKTPMGLEPFEVRFFIGKKFTKFDLAAQQDKVSEDFPQFFSRYERSLFFVKSLMGTPLHSSFFTQNFFFS